MDIFFYNTKTGQLMSTRIPESVIDETVSTFKHCIFFFGTLSQDV